MLNRFCLGAILSVGFILPFTGCNNTQVGSIQISPAAQSLVVSQKVQFTATGIVGHGSHPASSQDVTSQVTWTSSTPDVATVSSTGLATAVSAGTTTISASMAGSAGATAALTVTAPSGGGGGSYTSLIIIPSSQKVGAVNETGQYIAFGTLGTGVEKDVTDQVKWGSSDVKIATINNSGLATGLNCSLVPDCTTTISAIGTNPDGSVVTATALFIEAANGIGTQLATLTVYKVGANAATGTVTVVQPGTTTVVIDCGVGSGCTGNFPIGATVQLVATPASGSTFGGWSVNCVQNQPVVPTAPNTCTLSNMPDNATVGAIFN